MSIPRAKKSKQAKPQREPFEIVMLANYLNMAIVVRTLWTEYGWRDKRIARFIEGYLALMQEVADGRSTVQKEIADCKALTGVDVKALIDELYQGGKKTMIVYIAGKVTGDPDCLKKFADAEKAVKGLDFDVINPAAVCASLPKSFSWRDYMEITHKLLLRADAVAYLPDWKESPGTCIELGFAYAIGKYLIPIADYELLVNRKG